MQRVQLEMALCGAVLSAGWLGIISSGDMHAGAIGIGQPVQSKEFASY